MPEITKITITKENFREYKPNIESTFSGPGLGYKDVSFEWSEGKQSFLLKFHGDIDLKKEDGEYLKNIADMLMEEYEISENFVINYYQDSELNASYTLTALVEGDSISRESVEDAEAGGGGEGGGSGGDDFGRSSVSIGSEVPAASQNDTAAPPPDGSGFDVDAMGVSALRASSTLFSE